MVRLETETGWELLRRMGRGELVGEVGFYTRKHSAEVVVVERARLLRLTEKTFDRLNRRSPGIAAIPSSAPVRRFTATRSLSFADSPPVFADTIAHSSSYAVAA